MVPVDAACNHSLARWISRWAVCTWFSSFHQNPSAQRMALLGGRDGSLLPGIIIKRAADASQLIEYFPRVYTNPLRLVPCAVYVRW